MGQVYEGKKYKYIRTENSEEMTSISVKKRARLSDLSNENTIRRSPKASNLICLVCGATATGFNFSVITCMCCKAFFRRNALYGLEAYQCRYLSENCSINMRTRRDCSYCRLKKCFEVGMKKELILTEDVKRMKREKLHANRQLTLALVEHKHLLKDNDSITLKNLADAYERYCLSPIITYEKREYEISCHQPIKSRIKLQHYTEWFRILRVSLERFYKFVPELQEFPDEEQKSLVSHNIIYLMRVNCVETLSETMPTWGAVHFLLEIIFGKTIIDQTDYYLHQLKYYLPDARCTQLLLIMLFFSPSNNYVGHINTLTLYRIQEKYTNLFWLYLKQYFGEVLAYKKYSTIIRYILNLQNIHHAIESRKQDAEWQEYFLTFQ